MSTQDVQAIDVHAHVGTYRGSGSAMLDRFYSGGPGVVLGRARRANTRLTVVSSLRALLPRLGGDPLRGNREAARLVARRPGLLQWVVVDPLKPETYRQAETMLTSAKTAGIKIHPEEHGYPIRKHGRKIFEFAERLGAVVQTHSGEKNSLPEDFLPFANDFPGVTLILSHLGCGWDGDLTHQVRAIGKCRRGNLYTDTSSARSLVPNLLEWAVGEIGADRILYGTDTPLYFSPMQRARIDHADLTDADKRLILCGNAVRLLAAKIPA